MLVHISLPTARSWRFAILEQTHLEPATAAATKVCLRGKICRIFPDYADFSLDRHQMWVASTLHKPGTFRNSMQKTQRTHTQAIADQRDILALLLAYCRTYGMALRLTPEVLDPE